MRLRTAVALAALALPALVTTAAQAAPAAPAINCSGSTIGWFSSQTGFVDYMSGGSPSFLEGAQQAGSVSEFCKISSGTTIQWELNGTSMFLGIDGNNAILVPGTDPDRFWSTPSDGTHGNYLKNTATGDCALAHAANGARVTFEACGDAPGWQGFAFGNA